MRHFHLAPLLLVLGCALSPAADLDSEEAHTGAHEAGRLVIAGAALDNGPPWFGATVQAELTASTPLQAWTFELPSAAAVTFVTQGTATGPDVDTVLYLYRRGARGWGSYLARNDDAGGTVFSSLARTLSAGRYRVVVRGRTRQTSGPFALSAECAGAGCPVPEQPSDCVFGSAVRDLPAHLRVSNIFTFTSAAQLPDERARAELLASAKHAPFASVATADDLFAAVDGGLVRWMRIWDDAGGAQYSAYEYLVDQRSYGAVLHVETGEVAAQASAGRWLQCRVPVARCLLGQRYQELRVDPRFDVVSSAVVALQSASTLSEIDQAQLLAAVRVAYEDVTDLAEALESVDANQVNRLVLSQTATGRRLVVYEYGAGDNSYGGAFLEDARSPIARIEDGAFQVCTLRE